MTSLPSRADLPLVKFLRAPFPFEAVDLDPAELLARAEIHGLAGVVYASLQRSGVPLAASLERQYGMREAARALDHRAHLALLGEIDRALAAAGLVAVALKGPLLAERLYAEPSARPTSDIDLLVAEADLDRALAALGSVGYEASTDPSEARFRREHHHLHLFHPKALPLELHFHAYVGFGRVLPSEPLVERRVAFRSFRAIGVLPPEDELVYLAVHAAAHRFGRLAWLYDLRLLVEQMTERELEVAAERARAWGYARPLAFAAGLVAELFDLAPDTVRPLGRVAGVRGSIVRRVVAEPERSVARSATRFVYTAALCDALPATARYASRASLGYARRVIGRS